MRKWLIVLIALPAAGRDRMQDMWNAADEFGDSMAEIRRENEEKERRARRDSMERASDSLENEIRRMELEMKRIRLEEMRRKAKADSADE